MSVASVSIGARPLLPRGSAAGVFVALLVTATSWSVLAAGWSDSTPSVVVVALAGVVEGVLLARARASRLLALASAPLLLFVSLLPTSWSSRPLSGSAGIAHVVEQYAAAAATGLLGNARWEFNIGLAALLWVCGAWGAWFALRERSGAIATGPCWAVVAVNVINAPSTTQVTLPAALAASAALMLIAAVHLDRLSDSWRRRSMSVLPGTDGRFAAAAAGGGILIVLLALVAPPLSSTDISGRLFASGTGSSGTGPGNGPGVGSGGGATVRFNAATIPGGALTLSNSQVFTYGSSLATGVYLRMATDGVFADGNFLPDQSANNNGDDVAEIVQPGTITRDRLLSDGAIGSQRQAVSVNVTVIDDTSGANTLPFAGEPDVSGVAATVSGLTGPEAGGQLLTVDSVDALGSLLSKSVVTSATESTATADQLRRSGTEYPAFVTRDFLALPDDGSGGAAAVRALALQWTTGTASAYDKAAAIESNLRNPHLFQYTLKPPLPPASSRMWPLTYFLTTSHSGYCQYFADAMGAMLRAVGIPSRTINGYGPGTSPNAAARGITVETSWTVSSNDAHTWVEAYFPGYGWIPFEPTPPSVAGDYQPFGRGALGQVSTGTTGGAAGATPTPKQSPAPAASQGSSAQRSTGPGRTLIIAGAIAAALLVAIALLVGWFLRPRDIRGVWQRMGVIGRLLGVPRDRSLTFDEYVTRLAAVLAVDHPGGDGAATGWRSRIIEALRDIAATSDRAFYADAADRSDEAAHMKTAWRRIAVLAPHLRRRAVVTPVP
jgi:transglutaminase-like putative cysteine protease